VELKKYNYYLIINL